MSPAFLIILVLAGVMAWRNTRKARHLPPDHPRRQRNRASYIVMGTLLGYFLLVGFMDTQTPEGELFIVGGLVGWCVLAWWFKSRTPSEAAVKAFEAAHPMPLPQVASAAADAQITPPAPEPAQVGRSPEPAAHPMAAARSLPGATERPLPGSTARSLPGTDEADAPVVSRPLSGTTRPPPAGAAPDRLTATGGGNIPPPMPQPSLTSSSGMSRG